MDDSPHHRRPGLEAPDPGGARSLDELVERLRSLKVWAGDPSYGSITARINKDWSAAGRPAGELARRSTVADCFKLGRRRVNAELAVAVVRILRPDKGYVAHWRQAFRVVAGEAEVAAQVRVQGVLPDDLPEFTGRKRELDRLRQALADGRQRGAVVISIEGMAGVGKTELAVHAGHLLAAAFDQVLFVNLRGFDPGCPPQADPAAVLDGFLRLLGMPGHKIPHGLPARKKACRDRLAGRSTLVILDNAATEDQVEPLIARTPGCHTLITSRRNLSGLAGATHLRLPVFDRAEVRSFLADASDEVPVGADPRAIERIAERCGCLPLALRLVAGSIRSMPGWTLTDHADRLDERYQDRRLDTGVELALEVSYLHLPADRQRLLRLAAQHPGQELDAYAAAAMTGLDLPGAQEHLDQLRRDHLLELAGPGRYTFHDLVRAYATGRAADADSPSERRAALIRLSDHYLTTTTAALQL
ncbi:NB-ARC domain-containing protein [Kribbella catacumbae]|uniref:NB-ARC domain-containing protein n=1 Tax=Kribbella catacumbae TaxID=460086 RepID=UPI00035EB27E|nr:NB-ARC domain-containing protein [Kribbella catacumbae]